MAKWSYKEDIKDKEIGKSGENNVNKATNSKVTDKYCQTPEGAVGPSTAGENTNNGAEDSDEERPELRRSKRARNTRV